MGTLDPPGDPWVPRPHSLPFDFTIPGGTMLMAARPSTWAFSLRETANPRAAVPVTGTGHPPFLRHSWKRSPGWSPPGALVAAASRSLPGLGDPFSTRAGQGGGNPRGQPEAGPPAPCSRADRGQGSHARHALR